MLIFYSLSLTNLCLRLAVLIVLNFKAYFATQQLILSTVTLMIGLMVGTTHSQILCSLIIDLKTCGCSSKDDYAAIDRLRLRFNWGLAIWILVLVGSGIFFYVYPHYETIMLTYMILYLIHSLSLWIDYRKLNGTLNTIFGEN